jgi:hypothetical protein
VCRALLLPGLPVAIELNAESDTLSNEELHRLLHQEIEDLRSYTDSRVDKALGTIGTKQVLKG